MCLSFLKSLLIVKLTSQFLKVIKNIAHDDDIHNYIFNDNYNTSNNNNNNNNESGKNNNNDDNNNYNFDLWQPY